MYKLLPLLQRHIDAGITESKTVWRISDNTFIPFDPANTDYQAYLKWLEEGNTPEPADQGEQQ